MFVHFRMELGFENNPHWEVVGNGTIQLWVPENRRGVDRLYQILSMGNDSFIITRCEWTDPSLLCFQTDTLLGSRLKQQEAPQVIGKYLDI